MSARAQTLQCGRGRRAVSALAPSGRTAGPGAERRDRLDQVGDALDRRAAGARLGEAEEELERAGRVADLEHVAPLPVALARTVGPAARERVFEHVARGLEVQPSEGEGRAVCSAQDDVVLGVKEDGVVRRRRAGCAGGAAGRCAGAGARPGSGHRCSGHEHDLMEEEWQRSSWSGISTSCSRGGVSRGAMLTERRPGWGGQELARLVLLRSGLSTWDVSAAREGGARSAETQQQTKGHKTVLTIWLVEAASGGSKLAKRGCVRASAGMAAEARRPAAGDGRPPQGELTGDEGDAVWCGLWSGREAGCGGRPTEVMEDGGRARRGGRASGDL